MRLPAPVAAAMEFLALLAYPESPGGRARACVAMRAYYLRSQKKQMGTRAKLGKVIPMQPMRNQLRLLNRRLHKRLVAAHDCVKLDMGLRYEDGRTLSLNDLAADHSARAKGYERYKSDWWQPEVMHLAIVLRSVRITWSTEQPFTAETLLQSCEWIEHASPLAARVAALLRTHASPALRGFRTTRFLFPDSHS